MEYLGQLTADDMQSPSGGGMQYLGMLAPPPVEGFTDPVGNRPGEAYNPLSTAERGRPTVDPNWYAQATPEQRRLANQALAEAQGQWNPLQEAHNDIAGESLILDGMPASGATERVIRRAVTGTGGLLEKLQRNAAGDWEGLQRATEHKLMAAQGSANAAESWVEGIAGGAAESLSKAAMFAPLGGPAGIIAAFVYDSTTDALEEARQAGLEGNDIARYAAGVGVLEGGIAAAFQAMGLGGFESMFKSTAWGGVKEAGKQILAEVAEEEITAFSQAALSVLEGVNPDALSDPGQLALDTAAATVLAMGTVQGSKAAVDFANNPSRKNAKAAGVDLVATNQKERANLAGTALDIVDRRSRVVGAEVRTDGNPGAFSGEQRALPGQQAQDGQDDAGPTSGGPPPQDAGPAPTEPDTDATQSTGDDDINPAPSSAAAGIVSPLPDLKIGLKKAAHSVAKTYKKYFTSSAGRPELVEDIVQQHQGFIREHARKMKDLMGDMETAARKAYKVNSFKQVPSYVGENLQKALNDPKSPLWKKAPPELAASMRRVRDHIDELSRFASRLPDVGPELNLTIEGNLGTYTTRTYRKFDEKGWRSKALGDEQIMSAFAAEVRRTAPQATDAEIRTLAEIMLDAKTLDLSDVSGGGSSFVNVLKKRKDIPDAVRALYGERKDAFQNYERTVGAITNLVGSRVAAASLADAGLKGGIFWPDAASTPPGSDAVKFDSQTLGVPSLDALDGLVMNKDVRDSIVDAYKTAPTNKYYGAVVKLSGLAKAAKTVGSFQSAMRNFWGNVPMLVGNGVYDVKAVLRATAAVQGGDTFGLRKGNRDHQRYMQRMSRLGLLEDVSMAELRNIAKTLSTSIESYLAGVDPASLVKRGTRKASAFYQGMDAIFKIAQFESMRPQYAEAFPGMSDGDLDAYVAKIVRDTLPTYSNASKAARAVSKFPLAGPFAIFSFEVLRTSANRARITAQELRSDNPALRKMGAKKLAGQAVAYGGAIAAAALTRAMFGVSDEEDEALHKLGAPWQRYTQWIYTGRQPDGTAKYLDYGYMNPFGVFMDPLNAVAQGNARDAVGELAEPLVGEDLATGALISIWRGHDDKGAPVYDQGLDEPQQLKQIWSFLWNRFEPGTWSSMKRVAKGYNDEKSSGGKKYDFWRELTSAATGVRLDEFDIEQSAKWRHGSYASTINAAGKAVTKRFGSEETQSLDELAEVYRSADRVRRRAFKEWRGLMTDLEVLGIDDPLRSAAERGAGSAKLRRMVYAEQYEPYLPSNSTMRSWKQRLPDANERIALLGQLYEESLQQDQQ